MCEAGISDVAADFAQKICQRPHLHEGQSQAPDGSGSAASPSLSNAPSAATASRPPAPLRLSLVSQQEKKNHKDKKNNATPVLLLLLHLLSTPPKVVVATPRFCCRTSGWGFTYQSAVLLKCRGCGVSQCQRQRRGRGGGGSGDGNVCQEASQD